MYNVCVSIPVSRGEINNSFIQHLVYRLNLRSSVALRSIRRLIVFSASVYEANLAMVTRFTSP